MASEFRCGPFAAPLFRTAGGASRPANHAAETAPPAAAAEDDASAAASRAALALLVARTSTAWLAAANLVGVLLAALLLWPELNDTLAPLTYGRWAPVHLDAQLYGWCALPLVGLLLRGYLVPGRAGERHAALALAAWSAALVLGCASWLAGRSSGKLFLDWSGADRIAFALALCLLWSVLAHHALRRLARARGTDLPARDPSAADSGGDTRSAHARRLGLLAALLAVPVVLYFAAEPQTYPPVNPHSGGATGTSLFGSTLALLVIFAAVPALLQLPLRAGLRRARLTWPVLLAGAAGFAAMDHGHASHHAAGQVAGLAALFAGPWLIARDWRRHAWAGGSRRWLLAAGVWGALLVADGWVAFLPGFSERLKFTNALVAHTHLAMAGLVTSLHAALLLNLGGSPRVRAAFSAPGPFLVWQLGAAVQVVLLTWLGWREGAEPWLTAGGAASAEFAYAVRAAVGAAMAAAGFAWLFRLLRRSNPAGFSSE